MTEFSFLGELLNLKATLYLDGKEQSSSKFIHIFHRIKQIIDFERVNVHISFILFNFIFH